MTSTANPVYGRDKSVVTVGNRATLPSIYVENERSSNLRFRNRIEDENNNNMDDNYLTIKHKPPLWNDSALENSATDGSYRTAPSYGTPGTTASLSTYDEDFQSPDSGILEIRSRTLDKPRPAHPTIISNPNGSYMDITTTRGEDIQRTPTMMNKHEEQIRESLEKLQRHWRRTQRRAALYGTKEVIEEAWDSLSDLDTVKELMPIVVTTIIIASCFVTICMLSAGLVRNPSAIKLSDNANGKYKSIEFGREKLTQKLTQLKRLPPKILKDENGNILGGKKAAIQFAYNLMNNVDMNVEEVKLEVSEPATEAVLIKPVVPVSKAEPKVEANLDEVSSKNEVKVESDEVIEKLTLKVASKVVDMYDKLVKDKRVADDVTEGKDRPRREDVLDRIRKFGHFTTTKVKQPEVKEMEFDQEDDEDEDEADVQVEEEDDDDLKEENEIKIEKPTKVSEKMTLKADVNVKAKSVKASKLEKTTKEEKPSEAKAGLDVEQVQKQKKKASKKSPRLDPFRQFIKRSDEKILRATSAAKIVHATTTAKPEIEKVRLQKAEKKSAPKIHDEDDPFRSSKLKAGPKKIRKKSNDL